MIRQLFKLLCLSLMIQACTTDDILPALELEINDTNLSEDSGMLEIKATLNTSAAKAISIPVLFSGTATQGVDFSVSSPNITIASGNTTGNIMITGLQDQEIEGSETITVSLQDDSGYLNLSNPIEIAVLDDDTDSDNDGVLDANDNCPNEFGPPENDGCPFLGFLINEVLYDPPNDLPGDANGDGTRSPLQDEFIEFFNSGPTLDLSGYTISDADQVRHVFPDGTELPVNGILVVFGGGTPTGNFGGAIVQTASSGQLNMSNAGDFVTLADQDGNAVLTFDVEPLSNNPDESYTRNPDLSGEFEQHAEIDAANGALFSPGTKLDGNSF